MRLPASSDLSPKPALPSPTPISARSTRRAPCWLPRPPMASSTAPRTRVDPSAPLPSDLAQLVPELALDHGRRGVGRVGASAGDPGLGHFLRYLEPQALERHAHLPRQRLGHLPLLGLGKDCVK